MDPIIIYLSLAIAVFFFGLGFTIGYKKEPE